jgi:murein DD-endopeptidase MepM/ murein hydrolase activator NlpD
LTITRKQLVVALLSASFISTSTASAQQASNQTNAARPQSTNQVVGAAESKPVEPVSERPRVVTPATTSPTSKAETPAQPATAFELAEVIPSAPNIVKRSATAIEIPVARRIDLPVARRGAAPLEIPLDLFPELKTAPKADAKTDAKAEVKAETRKVEPKYESRPVISTAQVGSSFGYRSDPFTGRARFHSGCDIKARWGDSVGASLGGIVQYVGWYHGYGNIVIVNHGSGVTTHYAHLSSFDVQVGQRVERGQIVGRAGATGRATSPHLHYELRIDGNPVNPFQPLALDPTSDYFKRPAAAPEKTEVPKPALQLMLVP